MLFNSFTFLVFFPLVLVIFYSIPHRFRIYHLLAASYIFYMFWRIEYIALILASTLVDYMVGIYLEKNESPRTRRALLFLSLSTNLGLLFIFKYFNFFLDSTSSLFNLLGFNIQPPLLNVVLPVGISFYTFQTLSYSIEVYRRKKKGGTEFLRFCPLCGFFSPIGSRSH